MPTIAFWNLGQQNQVATVAEFLDLNGIEILIVAEQNFADAELILAYADRTHRSLTAPEIIQSRVNFYSVFPIERFRLVSDDNYVSIKEYQPLVGSSILIVGVHLPSKMFEREFDQPFEARRLVSRIEEAESLVGHDRTVVIGDLNMNPFEPGVVASDGLHGIMDRRIAARGSRTVSGESRPYFYNPMWKSMGDNSAPALGTFYRASGSYVHYFWNTFDQVLIRPSLLGAFDDEDLRVVDVVGAKSLLLDTNVGIDKTISDHLPIVVTLNT